MAVLGPFETAPLLVVGVSGGADSLALVLLADDWARGRGGRAIALTVDHRLRAASADEARTVGRIMSDHDIEHHALVWRHGASATGSVQASARDARRRLLLDWCAEHGALHLLLGHHRDDQAETVTMRAARTPTGDGVAGMSAIVEMQQTRILRPLLGYARSSIEAFLQSAEQSWIDDPSNVDRRFERVRIRLALVDRPAGEVDATVHRARAAATERAAAEDDTASQIASLVFWDAAGFARLDGDALRAVPPAMQRRIVGRVVRSVAGRPHVAGGRKLDRLCARFSGRGFQGGTIAGCRLIAEGRWLLICREMAGVGPPVAIGPGDNVIWDGRYRIRLDAGAPAALYAVAALGEDGWRQIKADIDPELTKAIP